MADITCDVLVVGAGPAGVSAGMLLGDFGIHTVVIDRRTTISDLPRGRGIHARAAEILRQLGIEAEMAAAALPTAPRVETRRSLADAPSAVIATGADAPSGLSPCHGLTIAQDVFETVLRSHVTRRRTVDVRLGLRLVDFTVDGRRQITATLVDEGSGRSVTVLARYLLGADGWRSEVRHIAGIGFVGDELGSQRSVLFRADLTAWLGKPPPVFVRLPAVDAVLVPTHPDNRWVLTQAGDEDGLAAADLVRTLLGVDVQPEVLGEHRWVAGVRCAEDFRRGPILLLGDAAHRLTPAGAAGIGLAMADAHNLAWKIAGVLRGWAGHRALVSYDQERGSVARAICDLNYQMWHDLVAGRPSTIDLRSLDMGYHYVSSIVMSEHSQHPHLAGSPYRPTAVPGARAPHVWLGPDARASTLDAFGRGFVLVTGPGGRAWADAAVELQRTDAVPLEGLVLNETESITLYGLTLGGAVLVRPDGHVAWRFGHTTSWTNASQELREVLLKVTGR